MARHTAGASPAATLPDAARTTLPLPPTAAFVSTYPPRRCGIAAEIMNAHGPDSTIGYMVSTLQGSTETTFYVLAVYFGAVRVTRTRHALPACLLADVAGILAAVLIVNLIYG